MNVEEITNSIKTKLGDEEAGKIADDLANILINDNSLKESLNNKDKEIYDYIRENCDKSVWISDDYNDDCMQKRNRHLVNNSNLCICYLTDKYSGTQYTVDYAIKKGLKPL